MRGSGAVLGLSFDYHDAAAALVVDGRVAAAAAEERFSRIKHDPSLPRSAMAWCLESQGMHPGDLDGVVFYSTPLTTYERIIATHARLGPRGVRSFARAAAMWSRRKLWVAYRIEAALRRLGPGAPPVWFAEHHLSHAAAAFYPSPFEHAAVLTFDGVGEWATSSIGIGSGSRVDLLGQLNFPDSLGLLYSTVTALCGFEVNDGEYKLMGLAPYGEPSFVDVLRREVVDVAADGSIRLDQRYFDYRAGERMASPRLHELLGGPPRRREQPLGQREADLARSVQVVLEEAVLAAARHAATVTGERRAVLAGGVALNCVANGRLLDDGPFDELWIQPAAGDDGGALGAALWGWHGVLARPRSVDGRRDAMRGAALGPSYSDDEVADWLTAEGVESRRHDDWASLWREVAGRIAAGAVVGWFQGAMEFGPRALGHRSILADPTDPSMVARLNSRVKQREDFRPFAPAITIDAADRYLDTSVECPYMLLTRRVTSALPVGAVGPVTVGGSFADRLAGSSSLLPACTHVDGSARVQTVAAEVHPELHGLLVELERSNGHPVVLNTSFNGPGEPIVRTPADAMRCAAATGLDLLVLGRHVVQSSAWQAGSTEVAP